MHITQIQDLEGFISLGTLSFGNSKSVIILLSRRIPLSFGHQQYAWYHDFGGTDSMFTLCAAGRLSLQQTVCCLLSSTLETTNVGTLDYLL